MTAKSCYIVTITLADGTSPSFPYHNEEDALTNAQTIYEAFMKDQDQSDIISVVGAEVDYDLNIMEFFTQVN